MLSSIYDVQLYMFNFSKTYCSKTVPTENWIELKTKEIHFRLFYFHFNYVMDRIDLARDKQYGGNM